jgi:hypothetical protein
MVAEGYYGLTGILIQAAVAEAAAVPTHNLEAVQAIFLVDKVDQD